MMNYAKTDELRIHVLYIYAYMLHRVFTGNCGKVVGNNTAVYQLYSYYYIISIA